MPLSLRCLQCRSSSRFWACSTGSASVASSVVRLPASGLAAPALLPLTSLQIHPLRPCLSPVGHLQLRRCPHHRTTPPPVLPALPEPLIRPAIRNPPPPPQNPNSIIWCGGSACTLLAPPPSLSPSSLLRRSSL
jgi:hypothetical protein